MSDCVFKIFFWNGLDFRVRELMKQILQTKVIIFSENIEILEFSRMNFLTYFHEI